MQEHHDAIGGTAMMIGGMLIQWVHGFDEICLLIAHGAGAVGAVIGAWLIVRKLIRDRRDNP